MKRRIYIKSDGTGEGTNVFDADTNDKIHIIKSLSFNTLDSIDKSWTGTMVMYSNPLYEPQQTHIENFILIGFGDLPRKVFLKLPAAAGRHESFKAIEFAQLKNSDRFLLFEANDELVGHYIATSNPYIGEGGVGTIDTEDVPVRAKNE